MSTFTPLPFGLGSFSGGASAAAGGAAASSGGLGFLGPAGLFAGAALGIISGAQRNRAARRQAQLAQQRANDVIEQIHSRFFDDTGKVAGAAKQHLDAAEIGAGFDSSPGITVAIANRIVGGSTADQIALEDNRDAQVRAQEAHKQDIVANANAQIRPLIFDAVGGGLSGAQAGQTIAGAFSDRSAQALRMLDKREALLDIEIGSARDLAPLQRSLLNLQLSRSRTTGSFITSRLRRFDRFWHPPLLR